MMMTQSGCKRILRNGSVHVPLVARLSGLVDDVLHTLHPPELQTEPKAKINKIKPLSDNAFNNLQVHSILSDC